MSTDCPACAAPTPASRRPRRRPASLNRDVPLALLQERAAAALDPVHALLQEGAGVVLSVSGGKDSQGMVDYVMEFLQWAGIDPTDRVVLINADLGRAEWDVADQLRDLSTHYNLPLYVVKPVRDLLTSIRRRGKWPDMARRYCTSDHKRGPIQKEIRRICEERGWTSVISCTGERGQESPRRRKLAAFEPDTALTVTSRKVRRVWSWRPLLAAQEDELWARIKRSGLPPHPIYAEGMRRLSCSFCVFGSLSDLRIAKRLRPDLYQEYVEIEAEINHSFRQGFRIADLDKADDDGQAGPD